jgi:hypothetical protein
MLPRSPHGIVVEVFKDFSTPCNIDSAKYERTIVKGDTIRDGFHGVHLAC